MKDPLQIPLRSPRHDGALLLKMMMSSSNAFSQNFKSCAGGIYTASWSYLAGSEKLSFHRVE